MSDDAVRLSAGDAEVTVQPGEGARLSSLSVGGTELLVTGRKFGSFVMVPWCGRTGQGEFRNGGRLHQLPRDAGEHAIHGTVRNRRWDVVDRTADGRGVTLDCELAEPWPYAGRVTQRVELAEDGGGLTLTLAVETATDSFPAQVGWHPWFRRQLRDEGSEVKLDFSPAWQLEREGALATTREIAPRPGPWDDCFAMPDGVDVTLDWPGELRLRITSRAEWVVLYDEQPHAVCVEPQSGPPNGLNTHPRLVTPIDPLEQTTEWTWTR
jgi:galactose mutarotase-like enzyme